MRRSVQRWVPRSTACWSCCRTSVRAWVRAKHSVDPPLPLRRLLETLESPFRPYQADPGLVLQGALSGTLPSRCRAMSRSPTDGWSSGQRVGYAWCVRVLGTVGDTSDPGDLTRPCQLEHVWDYTSTMARSKRNGLAVGCSAQVHPRGGECGV